MASARDEAQFEANARAVAAFRESTGRLPDEQAQDREEARLGRFLYRCRTGAFRGGNVGTFVFNDTRKALLDGLVPGWRTTEPRKRNNPAPGVMSQLLRDDRKFEHNARRYAQFLATHGRHPQHASSDEFERRLARWLARCRVAAQGKAVTPLFPERAELLDRLLPGWRKPRQDSTFRQRLDQLVAWLDSNQRWPQERCPDPAEAALGSWLRHVRHADTSGALSDERVQLMDERAPGWRLNTAEARAERFAQRLNDYAQFRQQHGREPDSNSPEMAERSLYQWMARLRRQAWGIGGHLEPERRQQLDFLVPGWLPSKRPTSPPTPPPAARTPASLDRPRLHNDWVSPRQIAQLVKGAERYRRVATEARRYPVAPCPPGEERVAASWLAHLRARLRRGELSEQEVKLLDEQAPGWDCTDVAFRHRVANLAEFVHSYGRLPDAHRAGESDLAAFLHGCRLSDAGRSAAAWSVSRAGLLDLLVPAWRDDKRG